MMHFFTQPKIHLDCFTTRKDVIEYAPVISASKVLPDWWKKLPKESNEMSFFPSATMKTCVGVHDYYKKSIAMPLWSDLCFSVNSDKVYQWQFSDARTEASIHPSHQYKNFLDEREYGHIKIHSPWYFKTKNDLDWIVTDPMYNRKNLKHYYLSNGLLNFSRQHATHIQLFIDLATPSNFIMPAKTVFLFTPLTDKRIVVHRHLVTQLEFDGMSAPSSRLNFINKYLRKPTKCPYKDKTK